MNADINTGDVQLYTFEEFQPREAGGQPGDQNFEPSEGFEPLDPNNPAPAHLQETAERPVVHPAVLTSFPKISLPPLLNP